MKDFTFKNYMVKDKVATPENPHTYSSYNDAAKASWIIFDDWKQPHTYATDAKDGVWPKERFGEPERQWYNFDSGCWSSDVDDPSFKFASNKRNWLPFIEQLEKEDGMVREASQELYKPHPEPNEYWYSNIAVRELQRMAFISGAQWQSTQFQEQLNELHAMLAKSGIDADLYNPLSLKIIEIKQSFNT